MVDGLVYWVQFINPLGRIQWQFSVLAATDVQTARLLVENQTGCVVMGIRPMPAWVSRLWALLRPLLSPAWPQDLLAEYFHSLGIMLKSGLPIDAAMSELTSDIKNARLRRFAQEMHAGVVAGNPLSVCLAHHEHQIPVSVRALIGVGERSGNLDKSLIEAGEHIKRLQTIKRDVGKALIYPFFAMGTIGLAVMFWIYYVLPELSRMFLQMGVQLPAYTRWIMQGIQRLQSLTQAGLFLYLSGFVLTLAIVLQREDVRRRVFQLLYRLPVSGLLIRSSSMAYITEYMALLIRAGLPLNEALQILAGNIKNPFYSERLQTIRDGVQKGNPLSQEMDKSGVFPAMVVRLVNVGEQTGTLDQQLSLLAEEHRQRFEHVIESLAEVLKPVLIIITGLFFIFVVVVFLLPVYQLIGQIIR